jgi:purine-cytosine permease-like protein
MVAAAMWLDTTVWQGPLSRATNGADFSIFMGTIVGGLAYYLLARRSVPREVAVDPDVEPVTARGSAKLTDLD